MEKTLPAQHHSNYLMVGCILMTLVVAVVDTTESDSTDVIPETNENSYPEIDCTPSLSLKYHKTNSGTTTLTTVLVDKSFKLVLLSFMELLLQTDNLLCQFLTFVFVQGQLSCTVQGLVYSNSKNFSK